MRTTPFVSILGGTTFDHIIYVPSFPQPVPHTIHQAGFREAVGSTGSGKALALTRLGVPSALYSVAGNDRYGHTIREWLEQNGGRLILAADPAGTERHINIMDATGGRISIFVTQSSETIDHDVPAIQALLDQSTVVVLNIISYCRALIPLVQAAGKPVWTDLHDYDGLSSYHDDFIEAAQYIQLSSDNLPHYRDVMERLISMGKEMVVCTHGRQGASLLTKSGEWLEQPALSGMTIVDSNGAGDSFFSGFLYGWLQQFPLQQCLKAGAICGAYAVTSPQLVSESLNPGWLHQMLQQ